MASQRLGIGRTQGVTHCEPIGSTRFEETTCVDSTNRKLAQRPGESIPLVSPERS